MHPGQRAHSQCQALIELVRACVEEKWRTHSEESAEDGYNREKEERTTENKVERRVPTRFENYWAENGRGDGQGDMEKEDQQSYRPPYMMGNVKEKEEKELPTMESKSMCHVICVM